MSATDLQQPEIASQITGPLGNFVEFKNGRSSPDRSDSGAFAVYGSNGKIGKADVTNAPEGTLVVGRVGSYCGSVHFSPQKCWVTDNAIIGSSRSQKDSRFWFYKLASLDLNNYRAGSGQPLLNQQILNSIQVSIPASEDNRFQIAKALATFDDKIDLNRSINQTLEAMAQALFQSWFVDFDPVKAKIAAITEGRDPLRAAMSAIGGKPDDELDALPPERYEQLAATAALFPEEMEESELGEIPSGWQVQRVSNVLELVYGKALKSTDRQEGSVPVYGSGGITGYHNTPLVQHGSIIVGRKGTVGSLYWEDEPFFPIDTTYYVRPLAAPLTFCYYAMQNLGLEKMNTDAAVPGLNRENVYRLGLVLPDVSALQKFDLDVSTLRKAIRANSGSNKTLANLRDSLLPKFLSGELSVTEVMAEAEV
jgi:type I restriction enzyme S subunit